MAPSEPVGLVATEVTVADLADCLALSDEAGWNQTEADWRLFLGLGRVVGIRDEDDRLLATAAALPYRDFGFVSMVLVTAKARRRGLATMLLGQAVADLRARNLTPVLDATPEGALVYARQGFMPLFGFARWRRDGAMQVADRAATGIVSALALDATAAGTDRSELLLDFASRPGSRVVLGDDAFAMARMGRRATQIGPLVAGSEAEAQRVLAQLLAAVPGAAFIDVPDRCSGLLEFLQGQGFSLARRFTRMALGRATAFGLPERQFALAGPEFG